MPTYNANDEDPYEGAGLCIEVPDPYPYEEFMAWFTGLSQGAGCDDALEVLMDSGVKWGCLRDGIERWIVEKNNEMAAGTPEQIS